MFQVTGIKSDAATHQDHARQDSHDSTLEDQFVHLAVADPGAASSLNEHQVTGEKPYDMRAQRYSMAGTKTCSNLVNSAS